MLVVPLRGGLEGLRDVASPAGFVWLVRAFLRMQSLLGRRAQLRKSRRGLVIHANCKAYMVAASVLALQKTSAGPRLWRCAVG